MADKLKLFCNLCLRETRHELLRDWPEPSVNGEIVNWQIVQCAGCETVSFYREHLVEDQTGWHITEQYVYPLREFRQTKHYVDAPAQIDHLYRETSQAFNNSSLLFCAGGLRALVEGICVHQGITDGPRRDEKTGNLVYKKGTTIVVRGKTLDCKIEGLAEKGILNARLAGILHEHRYLGNKALHELDIPDKETLEKALNIIEHIMEDLYTIPSEAADLQRRRKSAMLGPR
jgi:hypothetical protein